jgi:hypothetical protein
MPNITLVQAVLGFIAALAAALAAPLIGFFSRPQQRYMDYKVKQLDLIEKALAVGKSLSNVQANPVDVSMLNTEYLHAISSLSEPQPISDEEVFGTRAYALRLISIPSKQYTSDSASFWYWVYAAWCFISVAAAAYELEGMFQMFGLHVGEPLRIVILFINPPLSLLLVAWARHWAIKSAKLALQRDNERVARRACLRDS